MIEKVYILIAESEDETMSVVCHWHKHPSEEEIFDMVASLLATEQRQIFYIATANAHHVHGA
jgi:phage terminase large subunit-like protein